MKIASTRTEPAVFEAAAPPSSMLQDVLRGLRETPKRLPSKYFYDAHGSRLFDAICELPEYYLTRTELALMDAHVGEMASYIGPEACLIEMGSGSGLKTRRLLSALQRPAAYVPVEIAREHLEASVARLSDEFPDVEIAAVCGDFMQPLQLPPLVSTPRRFVIYFPGSTIGNLTPHEANDLLRRLAGLVATARAEAGATAPGGLLLGVDLQKDVSVLEAAYDDAAGLTARFNRNLLDHINARLGTQIPTDAFAHRAPYVAEHARIEMRLCATRDVEFEIAHERFRVAQGECIVSEYSHKYAVEPLREQLAGCGWKVSHVWTDPQQYFAVLYATMES